MHIRRKHAIAALAFSARLVVAQTGMASAQSPDPQPPPDPLRITEPTVYVRAQKEPENIQRTPVSVTAVSKEMLQAENITTISGAGIFAPNTFFSEFSARKLSFPHFRGISSGPGNPAITTYVDGVPMIHTNASSMELVDVEQVEFVRGAQSALFGRNALGGVINVVTSRPSLTNWTGSFAVPFGSYSAVDARGTVSGPLSGRSAISLSGGRSGRDGFTINDLRNQDVDSRSNTFGKAQLFWAPASNWETRVIVSGERARDGDYALADLGALESNPFHVQRDFEGRTDRDIVSGTFLARREGARMTLSSTTGIVDWGAKDETDLDYSPFPLLTRANAENATQFTQEVRLASTATAPVHVGGTPMRWQAGFFLFTQGYDQDAVNSYLPSPLVPFAVQEHSPTAELDDFGLGFYGQGTLTMRERLELGVGARVDYENKEARIDTSFDPPIAPPHSVVDERSFANVSPQVSVSYRVQPERAVYASAGTGYKSGGFNPASPVGTESYDEEHAWQVEGGMKTTWVNDRVLFNAAVFYIDWDHLQLNVPNPQVPAQFYIANVGAARSAGAEFELSGRAAPGFDLFASVGFSSATFKEGSTSSGVDVSGNALPSTPDYTTTFGARYQRPVSSGLSVHGRGEVVLVGAYDYDDANTAGQDAYSLTNLRGGVQWNRLTIDGWIRNAFDTRYVPIAFAYPGLAPSGFVGEPGAPRTYGVSVFVQF